MRITHKAKRWICRACLERKAVSIYRSVAKEKRG
jgi:hypothetical protein